MTTITVKPAHTQKLTLVDHHRIKFVFLGRCPRYNPPFKTNMMHLNDGLLILGMVDCVKIKKPIQARKFRRYTEVICDATLTL
ncbi:hypothetical protein EON83_24405 [bacterium]|nr:MAG: hypothetical protein EON83_24405 [bacterium]